MGVSFPNQGVTLRGRPSITKRNREKSRSEKKKDKAEERQRRKEARALRAASTPDGEDPDIAGIVCGPQPLDVELFGATSLTDD
jgi:hypothetical protein